jgi:hypothetical protein
MSFQLKILFTVSLAVLFLIIVMFVNRGDSGAVDAKYWRMGTNDSFRKIFLHPDGHLRPHSKFLMFALFVTMVAILWLVIP